MNNIDFINNYIKLKNDDKELARLIIKNKCTRLIKPKDMYMLDNLNEKEFEYIYKVFLFEYEKNKKLREYIIEDTALYLNCKLNIFVAFKVKNKRLYKFYKTLSIIEAYAMKNLGYFVAQIKFNYTKHIYNPKHLSMLYKNLI